MPSALESCQKLEGDDPTSHYNDGSDKYSMEQAGSWAQDTEDAFVKEESAGFGTAEAEDCCDIDGDLKLSRKSGNSVWADTVRTKRKTSLVRLLRHRCKLFLRE